MSVDPAWGRIHAERSWGTCPEPAMARWAIRHFGDRHPRGNLMLLDIGCGAGAQTRWLDQAGFSVHAIDGSEAAVWRLISSGDHGAIVRQMDVCDMHVYPDAMFDGAVDVCTLQHVEDIGAAISEVARVLKPGGRLFSMMASWEHMAMDELAMRRMPSRQKITELFGDRFVIIAGKSDIDYPDGGRVAHWLIDAVITENRK